MSTSISRTQFLRGDFSGQNAPVRPPWAIEEFLFTSVCNGCGDCVDACPTKIIIQGRGHFPIVDFSRGECLFCGDCAEKCKPLALSISDTQQPWHVKASIDSMSCMAYNGVECRSCYDPCEVKAITIMPRIGGVSIPTLDENICTGCGACHAICPASSIKMQTFNLKQPAQELAWTSAA